MTAMPTVWHGGKAERPRHGSSTHDKLEAAVLGKDKHTPVGTLSEEAGRKRQKLQNESSAVLGVIQIKNLDIRMGKAHVKKLFAKFGDITKADFGPRIGNGTEAVHECTATFGGDEPGKAARAAASKMNGKKALGKKLEVVLADESIRVATIAAIEAKLDKLSKGDETTSDGPILSAGLQNALDPTKEGLPDIKLRVSVKCKAKSDRINSITPQEPCNVYMQVRDNPRFGEANTKMAKMISRALRVKVSDVEITSGFGSEETKWVKVKRYPVLTAEVVAKRLGAAAAAE